MKTFYELHVACNINNNYRTPSGSQVLHRPLGCGQRRSVLVAVEAGQRDAVALQLPLDEREHGPGTRRRPLEAHHVRDRALLHHDLHDLGRLWQRRRRDRQREDLHHLHDDHRR